MLVSLNSRTEVAEIKDELAMDKLNFRPLPLNESQLALNPRQMSLRDS